MKMEDIINLHPVVWYRDFRVVLVGRYLNSLLMYFHRAVLNYYNSTCVIHLNDPTDVLNRWKRDVFSMYHPH